VATDAPAASTPTNHPVGFWFFFWGEFAERCSYYGMRAILALYMTERLGVDKADAGTFMSLFIAACYFFPLIGGYVADNFLGKYWTIVLFAVPYVVAQFMVGVENKYIVFGALVLLAMGSGVIKPNISTLMGLTYTQQRPGQEQLRTSAFSWFYMAINIGAALSQFAMPWLRTEYGYQTAFFFPAGLMLLALFIFALGKKYYAREEIVRKLVLREGEPVPPANRTLTGLPVTYVGMTSEALAAEKKLKWDVLVRIGAVFLTVMFFWAIFDQSASTWIFFADTYMDTTIFGFNASADSIQAFNPVFIVLLVPVSVWIFKMLDRAGYPMKPTQKMTLGFALTGLSMVIMSTAGYLAGAKQVAVKFTSPEGSLILTAPDQKLDQVATGAIAFGKVTITGTDWSYDKEKKKLTFANGSLKLADGRTVELGNGHMPGGGFPDAATFSAGGVLEPLMKSGNDLAKVKGEAGKFTLETVDWVKPSERVTVWWQVLAFLVITVAEILISITGLQLAFEAAPDSMKSFVTACWLAVVFLANLLINAPITRLYPEMAPGTYFIVLAGAMMFVIAIFQPVAAQFNRKMAEAAALKAANEASTEAV
jgi:POT family proton-dependent oligopeptide transporter